MLYECLYQDKSEMISAYLLLYHLALRLKVSRNALPVASVRLLASYYKSKLCDGMGVVSFIHSTFVVLS